MNSKLTILKNPGFTFILGISLTLIMISILGSVSASKNNFNDYDNLFMQTEADYNKQFDILSDDFKNLDVENINIEVPQSANERDKPSPANYFYENQIKVYKDRVLLDVQNIKWAAFEDTKSMLPIINKDTNALQIEPICPDQVKLGDIISYRSKYASGIIIHRVVFVGEDELGPYFILKGDNNPSSDPGKIRCDQIDRKVVAILY